MRREPQTEPDEPRSITREIEIPSGCDFNITETNTSGWLYVARFNPQDMRRHDDGWMLHIDELIQFRRRASYYIENLRMVNGIR